MIDISETMFTSNNYIPNPNQDDLKFFKNGKNINDNSIIKETIPIYDSNIGKTNNIYEFENLKYESGPYIDIDEKYLQGTTNIANKIEELSSNISNTKINLNERIDFLHENIHKADEFNKNEIININSRNLKELNDIFAEKDREIKYLQSIIEKQKEKINEIKEINNNLEIDLDNCIKIKDRCLSEKEEIFYEKKRLEDFYIKDLDEMQFAQEEEKKKLVNGYEDQFNKVNNDYHEDKNKLINELRNLQMTYDQIRDEHERNIEKLNKNKSRLDQDNKKRDIENEQLKKEIEDMTGTLKRTKTKIEEMEEEMKNNDLDHLQMAKEMESMSSKSKQIKRANTALGKSVFRSAYRPES
jgi:DNA repair exonuclease SbcCD ATPase subunit